jgi:hypothetical protein
MCAAMVSARASRRCVGAAPSDTRWAALPVNEKADQSINEKITAVSLPGY